MKRERAKNHPQKNKKKKKKKKTKKKHNQTKKRTTNETASGSKEKVETRVKLGGETSRLGLGISIAQAARERE